MSERVLAALAALALIAPGAAGQTPTVAEFAARARRLDTLAARADAFARRADSLRRAGITLDSARDGALLVLAGPHEVGLARDGVRLAWTGLDRTFGARAQLLAGNQFLLYQLGQQDPVPDSGGWYSGPSHVRYAIVSVAGWANAQDVSRTLLPNAANVIAQHEDSTFRLWLQAVITPGGVTQDLFRSVYNELVTAPWRASRGCFLGDLGACRRALALSGGGDPWVDWYASGDYRALVRDLTLARGDPALVNACLRTDDEAACLSVLRGNWYAPWYAQHGHRVPAPVSPQTRLTLVTIALERGGRDAYPRLMSDPRATIPDRLAAAAGEPFDSLLSQWRRRVIGAPAPPVVVTAGVAWVAVGWALVFGFLALRSTRWR